MAFIRAKCPFRGLAFGQPKAETIFPSGDDFCTQNVLRPVPLLLIRTTALPSFAKEIAMALFHSKSKFGEYTLAHTDVPLSCATTKQSWSTMLFCKLPIMNNLSLPS